MNASKELVSHGRASAAIEGISKAEIDEEDTD